MYANIRDSLKSPRTLFLMLVIFDTVWLRGVPHPLNMAPAGAWMIFAGATLLNPWLAVGVPLVALFCTDINFFFFNKDLQTVWVYVTLVTYGSHVVNVLLSRWIASSRSPSQIALATMVCLAQFFLATNLASWFAYYPLTLAGLSQCFLSALPFLWNSVLGDIVYVVALFGGLSVVEAFLPQLRASVTAAPAGSVPAG